MWFATVNKLYSDKNDNVAHSLAMFFSLVYKTVTRNFLTAVHKGINMLSNFYNV